MSLFKLMVEGNLGRDAEVKNINGQIVISFSIAVNQDYKDAQGVNHSKTTWINCNRWQAPGASTAIANYLKRGSKVIVEGTPEITLFKDANNNTRADFRCRTEKIYLLSSTANSDNSTQQSNQQPVNSASSNILPGDITEPMDDLPF